MSNPDLRSPELHDFSDLDLGPALHVIRRWTACIASVAAQAAHAAVEPRHPVAATARPSGIIVGR